MALFDVNVGIGRGASPAGGAFESADALLAEMRRLGIGQALVYNRLAAECDVEKGNRLLLEQLAGCPDLHACWMMVPPALGDLPEPGVWVAEAVDKGVRAVRTAPAHSLFTLRDWCVGPLAGALEAAGLPLFLDYGTLHWSQRVIPWDEVRALCEGYRELAVVVVGATVGATRDAVALLRRLPNLYLELSAFNVPDGLELLAREGLAGRLLFGTGMPARAGECVVHQVLRGGLDDGSLDAVAAANARAVLRLEEGVGQGLESERPYGGPVIDAHGHYGCWERTITPTRTGEAIVASMKRCGVDRLVGSSFSAIMGEMRLGNSETAALVGAYPEHLSGYCAINPHYPEEAAEELVRCFESGRGFVGLKLHCGLHEVQLEHPGYDRALAYADEHALPVLVHAGGKDDWGGVAAKYPRASFIIAHGCAWNGFDAESRELYGAARYIDNLYVDVAGSAAFRGAMRALINLVGVDKVLYGSDFPMFDLAFEVGRVARSPISVTERAAVLHGNAARLFQRLAAPSAP